MNSNMKHQIRANLLNYLQKNVPNFQKKGKMFTCPFQDKHEKTNELSANVFPEGSHNIHCFDPACGFKGDIFDVCRKLEMNDDDVSNDEIAEYLANDMNVKTDMVLEKLFSKYAELDWDMVPVAKGSKASNIEKEWQLKSHKDKNEWLDWIYAKINMGVQTGKKSNMFIIDIDAMPSELKNKIYSNKSNTKEKLKAIELRDINIKKVYDALGVTDKDTLAQHTFGGVHLIFEYDEDIPKCTIDVEGVHIDIETDGGQCVIEPSVVKGYERKFNDNKILKLPENIKTLILEQKIKREEPVEVSLNIDVDKDLTFENLKGNRNNTFIQLAGVLRKSLTSNQTKQTLNTFNQLLDKKVPKKEIDAIHAQMEKYYVADAEKMSKDVMTFLTRHKEASMRDLTECLNADKKDILPVISDLINEDKIYKQRSYYKPINKAEWKTEFIEESKTLPYDVPFFNNYCKFRRGDMICLGAETGVGKTHVAMNIIKKLKHQHIQPSGGIRYVSSEPGGRFGVVATSLGLKETDFFYAKSYEPERLELEDDAFTIIDWLLPDDFAGTANLYQLFAKQLDKHGGACVIFSQLNEKTGEFYAPSMVKMFSTLAAKYKYGTKNGVVDNINTKFETVKIRESKLGSQFVTIKTKYNLDTKTLELS